MEVCNINSDANLIERVFNNRESIAKLAKTLFKKILESSSCPKSFEKIIEECKLKNKTFIDSIFPANENSLIKGFFSTTSKDISKKLELQTKKGCNVVNLNLSSKWSKIKWLRSDEIYTNPSIFNKEIDPNDIKQGALNNCYFLSVLAALSEYPERIQLLFLSDVMVSSNVFGIKLCIDGLWEEIVVDDHFPCDGKKKVPCFSSGSVNSLWVLIMEKCYAKAYGSYHKIEGGIPEHAMRDLTGAPTVTLDNSNENLLTILKEACDKRWIVTASAGETDASKDLLREVGLIPMHAYTILEVQEFTIENDLSNNLSHNNLTNNSHSVGHSGNSINEFLLKIRNPWGKNEWIGDWSDFSSLWKDNLKVKNSNGCFYMNFKDFKHYFSKIQICKINDEYIYKAIELKQDLDSYCLVKMKIKYDMPSSSFVSLIHPDKKKFNHYRYNNSGEYKYYISRFILCKINNKDSFNDDAIGASSHVIEYIGGKMGQDREIFDERDLESGEYLIFIEIDWSVDKDAQIYDLNKSYPFVLSTYSANDIELTQVNNEDYTGILQNIYISCAKKNNNVVRFTNEGAPNCFKYTNVTPEGYAYIYFENTEEDATLIEDVKYTKFEGLKLLSPFSGTSYFVKISPGESRIVLIKQVDMTGFNLIYSYHSNFQFGHKRLLELTKLKGKKNYRKDTKLNIDVEIVVYTYKYSLGLCFYYENNTSDRKLEETLKIKSTGVEIVDSEDLEDNIVIVLGPGEKRLIELRAKKNNWSVQSSVSYKIESL